MTLGTGSEKFDDSTATLLLVIYTCDRWCRQLRTVGYSVLNIFVDSKNHLQPASRNVKDYVLNRASLFTRASLIFVQARIIGSGLRPTLVFQSSGCSAQALSKP